MSDARWYDIVTGESLRQGDLFFDCPVFSVDPEIPHPIPAPFEPTIRAEEYNLIVLTQSCDLDNDKVEQVLVASVVAWQDAVQTGGTQNPAIRSREFRRSLIAGNVPGLSLLHKHDELPRWPWSVVTFHRLFMVPKSFLHRFAEAAGPRLRLRSPYREHLAQAFARYFMRVGLPHDAKAFEHEGKVD